MKLQAIHGTIWDKPFYDSPDMIDQAMVFNKLSPAHASSKYDAVYFADNEKIPDFFAKEKIADEENQVLAQIKVELNLDKVFEIEFTPDISIAYGGIVYFWPNDRKSLYAQLITEGYDAVITKNEYRDGNVSVSDIAVLNPSTITPLAARVKLGDDYTPWMNEKEAKNLMSKWANNELNVQHDINHTYEYDY
jgi:hypothetical protein